MIAVEPGAALHGSKCYCSTPLAELIHCCATQNSSEESIPLIGESRKEGTLHPKISQCQLYNTLQICPVSMSSM